MSEDNQDRSAQAAKLVRNHMFASVASGILPIPILDVGILAAIQLRMLKKLADLYEVDFSEQRANAIIGSLAGMGVAATVGGVLLSLLPSFAKAVVGIGTLTLPPASTYALGQVFIKHFDTGGTFMTFDEERAKEDYKEKLVEGKKEVEQSYAGIKP